jgi:hypothetical protein
MEDAAALGIPYTTSDRSRPRGPGADPPGRESVIAPSVSDRRQQEAGQTSNILVIS